MSEIYAWLMPNGYLLSVPHTHGEYVQHNPSSFGTTYDEVEKLSNREIYRLAFEFGAVRLSVSPTLVGRYVMSLEGKADQIAKHSEKLIRIVKHQSVEKVFISYWPQNSYDEYTAHEFVMRMASTSNWYKEAMALDPNAYKTEPQPARLREHMESAPAFNPFTGKVHQIPQEQDQSQIDQLYSGVHFAFTAEQAALYACGKATKDDPPVIIEIEPKGLKQQPDVDAMVDQTLTYYIDDKKKVWQAILQSGNDIDTMAEELRGDVDGDVQNWTMESEVSDTADDVIMQQQTPIPPSVVLSLIEGKSSQKIISVITQLVNGKISPKMLIKLVGQMRVNNMIDSSRVKGIYQIPWIDLGAEVTQNFHEMDEERLQEELEERGWHQEGDDIINERGQVVPSYEELIYDQWLTKTPLYVNRQTYFKGFTSKESVWHGTTLSRAKSAYPDLLGAAAPVEAVASKTESWYKPPFMRAMNYIGTSTENKEKKETKASLSNKYIVTQAQKEGKKPYYVVIVSGDVGERPVEQLKDKREWAYSARQAIYQFVKKYSFLRDFIRPNMNMDIAVRLDSALLQREVTQRKERVVRDTKEQERKEERIRGMWWNKD